jgi:hypothetical protein
MSERNLLITILDTNPVWWGMQAAGLTATTANASSNKPRSIQENVCWFWLKLPQLKKIKQCICFQEKVKLGFNDCMSAIVGFLNTYKAMSQNNAVALIAAHNNSALVVYNFISDPKKIEV